MFEVGQGREQMGAGECRVVMVFCVCVFVGGALEVASIRWPSWYS